MGKCQSLSSQAARFFSFAKGFSRSDDTDHYVALRRRAETSGMNLKFVTIGPRAQEPAQESDKEFPLNANM
jgi:hypothetical protein